MERGTSSYKIVVICFYCVILLPNLGAFLLRREVWPYTTAPMFSQYIDHNRARYAFELSAEFEEHPTKRLGFYSVGANWSLWRYFFKYVYGSADPRSEFSEFPNDTVAQFEARMANFFKVFYNEYLKRNSTAPISLRLDLVELDWKNNQHKSRKTIGFYDPKQQRYFSAQKQEG